MERDTLAQPTPVMPVNTKKHSLKRGLLALWRRKEKRSRDCVTPAIDPFQWMDETAINASMFLSKERDVSFVWSTPARRLHDNMYLPLVVQRDFDTDSSCSDAEVHNGLLCTMGRYFPRERAMLNGESDLDAMVKSIHQLFRRSKLSHAVSYGAFLEDTCHVWHVDHVDARGEDGDRLRIASVRLCYVRGAEGERARCTFVVESMIPVVQHSRTSRALSTAKYIGLCIKAWSSFASVLQVDPPFRYAECERKLPYVFIWAYSVAGEGRQQHKALIAAFKPSERDRFKIHVHDFALFESMCRDLRSMSENIFEYGAYFAMVSDVVRKPSHLPWMRHVKPSEQSSRILPVKFVVVPSAVVVMLPEVRFGRSFFAPYAMLVFSDRGSYCAVRRSATGASFVTCYDAHDGSLVMRVKINDASAFVTRAPCHPHLEGTYLEEVEDVPDFVAPFSHLLKNLSTGVQKPRHMDGEGSNLFPSCVSRLRVLGRREGVQFESHYVLNLSPSVALVRTCNVRLRGLPSPSTLTSLPQGQICAYWYFENDLVILHCHPLSDEAILACFTFAPVTSSSTAAAHRQGTSRTFNTHDEYFDRDVLSLSYARQLPNVAPNVCRLTFKHSVRLDANIKVNGFEDCSCSLPVALLFLVSRQLTNDLRLEETISLTWQGEYQCDDGGSMDLNASQFTRTSALRVWLGKVTHFGDAPASSQSNNESGAPINDKDLAGMLRTAMAAKQPKLMETGFFAYKACLTTDTEKPCIVTLYVPPVAKVSNFKTNEPKKRFSDVLVLAIDRIPILENGMLDGHFRPPKPFILDQVERMIAEAPVSESDLPENVSLNIMCLVCGRHEKQMRSEKGDDVMWMRNLPCNHICCMACHTHVIASMKVGKMSPVCPLCHEAVQKCEFVEERTHSPTDFTVQWNQPSDGNGAEGGLKSARSLHNSAFIYHLGAAIHIQNFNMDLNVVCAAGVHGFMADACGSCFANVIQYAATSCNIGISFDHQPARATSEPVASSSNATPSSLPSSPTKTKKKKKSPSSSPPPEPVASSSNATPSSPTKAEKKKASEEASLKAARTGTSTPVASSTSTKKKKSPSGALVSRDDDDAALHSIASNTSPSFTVDQALSDIIAPACPAVTVVDVGDARSYSEAAKGENAVQTSPSSVDAALALWNQRNQETAEREPRTIYPSLEHWTDPSQSEREPLLSATVESAYVIAPFGSRAQHHQSDGSLPNTFPPPYHEAVNALIRSTLSSDPSTRPLLDATEDDLIQWLDEEGAPVEVHSGSNDPAIHPAVDLRFGSASLPETWSNDAASSTIDALKSEDEKFQMAFPSVPTKPPEQKRTSAPAERAESSSHAM